jgi:hypothetical protein
MGYYSIISFGDTGGVRMANIPRFAGFRAEQRHLDKLLFLASVTGQSTGDVLRALVENAEIRPMITHQPVATIESKSASVKVCETTTGAFAEVNP